MENITPTSFVLEVSEFGRVKRKYNDVNLTRFLDTAKSILLEEIDYTNMVTSGTNPITKNKVFHIYTE